MIIDTESIYSVDPHERAIVPRYGAIELDEYEAGVMVNTIEEPISIEGVQEGDLVIFGNLIDEEGVTDVRGFLVVQTLGRSGLMATLEYVMENPELQTPQLARKFALLEGEQGELEQLGVESLAPILRRVQQARQDGDRQ